MLIIVPASSAAPISEYLQLEYSSASTFRLPQITLKTYEDGEEEDDEDVDTGVQGTARLLKRFRSYITVSGCDSTALTPDRLCPPAM